MKRSLFIVILCSLFCTFLLGQNKVSDVVGVYQFCPYECESIKINADFTFNYFIEGHIGSARRTKGTWKFIDKNKISLENPKLELIKEVKEIKGDSDETILVTVRDFTGALFPGITVSFFNQDKKYMFQTGEDGSASIFRTSEIEISYLQSTGKYKLKNKNVKELDISIEPTNEPWIDSNFKLIKGQICRFVNADKIADFCHKKISKKKAKKIFPKKI